MTGRVAASTVGLLAVLTSGCDRSTEISPGDDAGATTSDAGTATPVREHVASVRQSFPPARDACELIPADELATMIGQPMLARREVLERPDESVCAYAPAGGWSVLYVTAYWRGGRKEWEARELARGSGQALSGIGDAAHYGGILPSLVLSGDVLLEFAMPLLPDEETNFPILARVAVSRL